MGQAINYCLSNWTALSRYIKDGILNTDNNPAENAIRPIVLGRKNCLLAVLYGYRGPPVSGRPAAK